MNRSTEIDSFAHTKNRLSFVLKTKKLVKFYPPQALDSFETSWALVEREQIKRWEFARMTDTVCDYLRTRIKEYLADKGESFRWLAKQAGVDYSTIYRLQSGEQRSLSFLNATRLLKFFEPVNYVTILSDFYPSETKELMSVGPEVTDDLSEHLAIDISLYRVFTFAAALNATREQVKEKYGSDGLQRIERLVELGVMSEKDGQFYDNLEGITFPSEGIIKRFAGHNFALISLDTPGSAAENLRGALNQEGLVEWHRTTQEYKTKLHNILRDKKGNIVVAGSIIIGPVE